MREFFDVPHHAIELLLAIDLASPAQGKTVESFVTAQIAEYALHRGEAPGAHGLVCLEAYCTSYVF